MKYCAKVNGGDEESNVTTQGIGEDLRRLIRSVKLIAFDFDGVLTDNRVYVFEDGKEAVVCSRSDGIGLRKLDRLGIDKVVISSESNSVVRERCGKLNIPCFSGAENKLDVLTKLAEEREIALSRVAFVGNDVNDLECLRAVGVPIVVQDAHDEVVPYARYRTVKPGGLGAVREVCDVFENVMMAE